MKDYRTDEQYNRIVQNAINGNWGDAGRLAAEAGFYAHDLAEKHKERKEFGGLTFDDPTDLAFIAESAEQNR